MTGLGWDGVPGHSDLIGPVCRLLGGSVWHLVVSRFGRVVMDWFVYLVRLGLARSVGYNWVGLAWFVCFVWPDLV